MPSETPITTSSNWITKPLTSGKKKPVSQERIESIRRNPTVAIVRAVAHSPLATSRWLYTLDPGAPPHIAAWAAEIQEALESMRWKFMSGSANQNGDYGAAQWLLYYRESGAYLTLDKMRQLPQSHATPIIEGDGENAGAFGGYSLGRDTVIPADHTLHWTSEPEGDNTYSETPIDRLEEVGWLDSYRRALAVCDRTDEKASGAQPFFKYPIGTTEIDGAMVDNAVVCRKLMDDLRSGSGIALPRKPVTSMDGRLGTIDEWSFEFLSPSLATTEAILSRLRHLETLVPRAYLLPERTVQEGQHGTKAESETQTATAVDAVEERAGTLADAVNRQVVQRLIDHNFGRDARKYFRVSAKPFTDDQKATMSKLFSVMLGFSESSLAIMQEVDMRALAEVAGVPVKKVEQVGEQNPAGGVV